MKGRMRYTLQARYSVHILLVIMISVVSLSVLSVLQFKSASEEIKRVTNSSIEKHVGNQLQERGRVMGQYLAQDLANPVVRYDMQAMRELLETTLAQRDIRFAYVYDANGRILHDGSPEVANFAQHIDAMLGWTAGSSIKAEMRRVGDLLHIVHPVSLGTQFLGGVALVLSMDEVGTDSQLLQAELDRVGSESQRRELTMVSVATVLFLLAGTLLALVSGRRMARPIRELASHARRVGQGEFGKTIAVARNDEIGDLAIAFRDMNEDLRITHNEVQFLAYHDPLTGLPNRAQLKRSLMRLCENCRERGAGGAVLFIDLDDFKPVNDTLGHDAGDALLREAAERLKECLREEPASRWRFAGDENRSVARLGGDEFTLMLEGIGDREDAGRVARILLERLSSPFHIAGQDVSIGASIGIASYPRDGRDGESLLAHADVAMYNAKGAGKHNYAFYEETMYERTRDRLFMINDLRRALDSDGLDVHYQPIVSGTSGRIMGVEALMRWHHPERGLLTAAEFIDVAEKSGEIERLGQWVISRVCSDLSAWRAGNVEGLFASVNISSRQLLHTDLSDLITGFLASHDLMPHDLRLEICEDRVLTTLGESVALLATLHDAGFEIWVDQFGVGPASLVNLQHTPARGIKLGHDFIKDIATSERARHFLRAIITMARSADLHVCAVGVTSEAQSKWLREQGCRYLQGQFLGPELTASELPGFLEFEKDAAAGAGDRLNLKAL